ncbi:polar amino acid transport system substrate-binding protein [Myxococcus fulvus]|uniref:Amino acid ABC transporter permease n=1 Tax=Myxococcus fulvus TaxID=33 RepID=A0A511TBT9_MYXFU|nr:ABC transporter substrate-binding protein/permease [Myxococcus fulvus]AKF83013.1 amino acid ABC transporter permease [Myxococcus fulvus 124B02]GEN11053.1 amino acid ABC transporter permease [Myxococcus fulvus]SET40818.1 polar amino acid transport system substrate-binding protein [Myxococcus fulvus]
MDVSGVWRRGGALLVFAVVLTSCVQREEPGLERVRRAGELRWGADAQGGEPYAMEDPDVPGHMRGFEVELADALARELGVRARFVQNDWSSLIPSLERGSFDVALNGIEVTPARSGRILFTRPYFIFQLRLLARREDDSVTGLSSLRGRRVGTLANSQAWDLLQREGIQAVPYEGVEEPYIDLEQGRVDAVLMDDLIAQRYGQPRPKLRVVGDVGEGYYAIAVRPGDEDLRAALDVALGHVARSGELRRIFARWNIDSAQQQKMVEWTDAQTREVLAQTSTAKLGWGQGWMFLQAALVTLVVSVGAMALAVPLGVGLALVRLYGPRWLSGLASFYVEVFRGTPVLLQLYVLYYGLAGVLRLDALSAAVLGLGLNYAAYEAEVYRAGVLAVPRGQMEAALALGMSTPLALRRVVFPQAFRVALPSVTNDFIALLKDSSLVSVISVVELTKRMTITAVDVRSWLLPGALCAALYLAMSYPLSLLARRLEARLARG